MVNDCEICKRIDEMPESDRGCDACCDINHTAPEDRHHGRCIHGCLYWASCEMHRTWEWCYYGQHWSPPEEIDRKYEWRVACYLHSPRADAIRERYPDGDEPK